MLKRIVKERVRRSSKRLNKFSLNDNDDDDGEGGGLTHRVSFIFCLYMHEMLWGEIDHIFFTTKRIDVILAIFGTTNIFLTPFFALPFVCIITLYNILLLHTKQTTNKHTNNRERQ